MKQPYCVIIISTPEALERVLSRPVSAVFVDEILLDDQTEAVMEAHGYLPGLIGWTGKLFLRPDFDFEKFDLTAGLESLGVQPDRINHQ